jgi:predicted nucleotidyltransferase
MTARPISYSGHMGRALGHTASELACSERTLRRYINDGVLRGRALETHRFELPEAEAAYVRRHWALLRTLRAALRTERNVRLAVLFGSMATGADGEASDVDVFVVLADDTYPAPARLQRRLEAALGRRVQVVLARDVGRSPSLLANVLDDGRVLIDRDRLWLDFEAQRDATYALAAREQAETLALVQANMSAAASRRAAVDGAR